jgi:raffinose/stachyose/melibiose transport system substrate-binding protein
MPSKTLSGVAVTLVLLLAAAPASSQTVLRWLHIDTDPAMGALYEQTARDFEAKHAGVKVVVQLLENEAYKAKLPTLLQSPERPHIIHTWGGGVMQAQVRAGVLHELDASLRGAWGNSFVPSALGAFRYQDKGWGVPSQMSQVGFYYNRALFAKAGVSADALKTWPQYLDAVKKLKAAPIIAGGGDKWPLHFYWTHLALRIGGKPAFEAAQRGEIGGFGGEVFVQAGERMKELIELKPFQPGWQAVAGPASYGQFGDGRGAMTLMGNWVVPQQSIYAANRKGLAEAEMGWFAFPTIPGGRGDPRETLGGVHGWLLTAGSPPLAVEL